MVYVVFVVLAIVSLLVNLSVYPFKNEESLRVIIAYEMFHSGNYIQPTFLGELYFNKPPLFNWLIVLYSKVLSWSELTVRAVSLTFLILTMVTTFAFSYSLFRNAKLSLLASLIFLTFGNVLFFYGYLGEIDITLTFFVFLMIYSLYLYYIKESFKFLFLASVLVALSFLLKGFPAYAFYGISLVVLGIYFRNIRLLFSKHAVVAYVLTLLIPLVWILSTQEPTLYLSRLFHESFSRVSNQDFNRLEHAFTYVLITLKDTLPWSLVAPIALYTLHRERSLNVPSQVRLLLLLLIANYIPYALSKAEGRYIIPLYPILAIIFAHFINQVHQPKFKKLLYFTIGLTVFFRFVYGMAFFPYYAQRETSPKNIALDIHSLVNNSQVACECSQYKSVCLYLGILQGRALKVHRLSPEANYVILCDSAIGEGIVKEYNNGKIKLVYLGNR